MYGRQWNPEQNNASESRNCGNSSGSRGGRGRFAENGMHGKANRGSFTAEEPAEKQAVRKAMMLLERMDRTEKQLREKLKTAEYPPEAIDAAITYVKSFHYLDDSRYAEYFVLHHQEKMSRRQLKQKMMEKGVPAETAERALEENFSAREDLQIADLLEKRHYDPDTADDKEFRRTCSYLMRRGFATGAILKAMKSRAE